jgi:hypothetical protein
MAHLDGESWGSRLGWLGGEAGVSCDSLAAAAVETSLFDSDLFAAGWPENPNLTAQDDCCYQNAATCPDCGSGMVRLGGCFSCRSCGYESCGI